MVADWSCLCISAVFICRTQLHYAPIRVLIFPPLVLPLRYTCWVPEGREGMGCDLGIEGGRGGREARGGRGGRREIWGVAVRLLFFFFLNVPEFGIQCCCLGMLVALITACTHRTDSCKPNPRAQTTHVP